MIVAPKSESELSQRVDAIAGLSLGHLAARFGQAVPQKQLRQKGWIGLLMEQALGTDASNLPRPDFQGLGIELKTLPIGANGKPAESTFVASIPLLKIGEETWETSVVYHKLKRVLWIPIEADKSIAMIERRIGQGFIWQANAQQMAALRSDWEELTELIVTGHLDEIDARRGEVLQIRPKGANARSLCWGINAQGERYKTLPRGFYIRPSFTAAIFSDSISTC